MQDPGNKVTIVFFRKAKVMCNVVSCSWPACSGFGEEISFMGGEGILKTNLRYLIAEFLGGRFHNYMN